MAGVPSMASFVENRQRMVSFSGKLEPATPVWRALPRNTGQAAKSCFTSVGDDVDLSSLAKAPPSATSAARLSSRASKFVMAKPFGAKTELRHLVGRFIQGQ